VNVTPDKLMNMFEDLAEKMDINIVQDKGNFNGGACTIDNESYIVVNKSKPIEQRLKILANAFKKENLTDTYLIPALRSYIDKVTNG
jgi:hypothetical protein|tara:strand:- start:5467 stop:5727 length:261 start_codon:yes stop_codon:yes gene_type:complete